MRHVFKDLFIALLFKYLFFSITSDWPPSGGALTHSLNIDFDLVTLHYFMYTGNESLFTLFWDYQMKSILSPLFTVSHQNARYIGWKTFLFHLPFVWPVRGLVIRSQKKKKIPGVYQWAGLNKKSEFEQILLFDSELRNSLKCFQPTDTMEGGTNEMALTSRR